MRLLTASAALAAALLTGGVPAVALIAQNPPATEENAERTESGRPDTAGPPAHAAEGRPSEAGKAAQAGETAQAGKPAQAGKHGQHGNPHGPDHAADMERIAQQHADAMATWGPCMESFDSATDAEEPPRAQKIAVCGDKPTPPGHLKNQHAGHQDWHKFHGGDHDRGKAQGNRSGAR